MLRPEEKKYYISYIIKSIIGDKVILYNENGKTIYFLDRVSARDKAFSLEQEGKILANWNILRPERFDETNFNSWEE